MYEVQKSFVEQFIFSFLLIVLSPKKNVKKESIFLDIKTVYQDPDNEWYYNPFKHHGIRMIKASELYAPNIEFRLGYTTYKGKEYWGREIPYKSAKIKEKLNSTEQLDLAYSVGTQLGRAHGKSLEKGAKAKDVEKHLQKHYLTFTAVAEQMNKEVNQAYQTYCKTLEHTYK